MLEERDGKVSKLPLFRTTDCDLERPQLVSLRERQQTRDNRCSGDIYNGSTGVGPEIVAGFCRYRDSGKLQETATPAVVPLSKLFLDMPHARIHSSLLVEASIFQLRC